MQIGPKSAVCPLVIVSRLITGDPPLRTHRGNRRARLIPGDRRFHQACLHGSISQDHPSPEPSWPRPCRGAGHLSVQAQLGSATRAPSVCRPPALLANDRAPSPTGMGLGFPSGFDNTNLLGREGSDVVLGRSQARVVAVRLRYRPPRRARLHLEYRCTEGGWGAKLDGEPRRETSRGPLGPSVGSQNETSEQDGLRDKEHTAQAPKSDPRLNLPKALAGDAGHAFAADRGDQFEQKLRAPC